MDIVKYLGVIGIVLMVVEYADPVETLKIYFNVHQGAKLKDNQMIRKIIQALLGCALCFGFWAGLGFYLDVYWAVIIAFSSEIAYRLIAKLFIFI